MKKLRVTVEGKAYDVLVEILDSGAAPVPAAPAPVIAAPVAMPVAAPMASVAAPISASVSAPVSAPTSAPAGSSGPGDVLSPLSGKIVSIDVQLGQAVAEGEQVATMEAMKMNTYIYAPKAGKVAAISAIPGDGVEEGSVLLRIA